MTVWERLGARFDGNQHKLVASDSPCAHLKKAHPLLWFEERTSLSLLMFRCCQWHAIRMYSASQSGHTKVAVMHLSCNGSQERLGVMTALVPSLILVAVMNRRELGLGADARSACSHTLKNSCSCNRLTQKGAFPCVYDTSLHWPS